MDINTFKVVKEVLGWVSKLGAGKHELKNKYQVLKELTIGGKLYKRGEYVNMYPSKFRDGLVRASKDQSIKEETIRKLKIYMDYRCSNMPETSINNPDVEFNSNFTKIKIYKF